MRISDWSSDVCSSDLFVFIGRHGPCECDEAVLAVEDKRRPLQFGDADWTESSLGIFRYVLSGRLPKQEGDQRVAFDDRRHEGDDIRFGTDIGLVQSDPYRAAGSLYPKSGVVGNGVDVCVDRGVGRMFTKNIDLTASRYKIKTSLK